METTPKPCFAPGYDVHPIQASLAFRDTAGMEAVRVVEAHEDQVGLRRADGHVTRHFCHRFAEAKELLAARAAGDGLPALWNPQFRVLVVIVADGPEEPKALTALGAFRLEDGAAVEMLAEESRALLFCLSPVHEDAVTIPD